MNGKTVSLAIAIVLVIAVLTAWLLLSRPRLPEQTELSYDFENGLGDWAVDAHAPTDPETGEPVTWATQPASNMSFSGNSSLLFYIDGAQDDGTIWIERTLTVGANASRLVNLKFQLWSDSESFNTLAAVVGYVGDKDPEEEADFQVLGVANQVSGWKGYSFSSEIIAGSDGVVHVALGISVRWEADLTYYIDDVTLTLTV